MLQKKDEHVRKELYQLIHCELWHEFDEVIELLLIYLRLRTDYNPIYIEELQQQVWKLRKKRSQLTQKIRFYSDSLSFYASRPPYKNENRGWYENEGQKRSI
jgi:hypothetical protein